MSGPPPPTRRRPFVRLILFCGTLLALVLLGGHFLSETKLSAKAITVKGFAERQIKSDFAIWSVRLTVRSTLLPSAYAKMEKDLAKVLLSLKEKGVGMEFIQVSSVTLNVKYSRSDRGFETNTVESYELCQTVEIRTPDVALVDRLSREITALIKDGVELTSQPPGFYYTKLEGLKVAMLGEAAQDARLRAETIAEKSGARAGKLLSAQQGVFQITPVYSSESSGEGMFDTSSVEKTIRAILTATYSLK